LFEGPDQAIRINCKEGAFYSTDAKNEIKLPFIDLVIVTSENVVGPLPPIDPEKIRDKDGPLRHHQGPGQKIPNLSKATDQEIAQVIYDNLMKVRSILWAFIAPSSYESMKTLGLDSLINQRLILTVNFHGVSVERPVTGFASYDFNLRSKGLRSFDTITRLIFDDSHTSPSGDMLQGLFFQEINEPPQEDLLFLDEAKSTIEALGDNFEIPSIRVAQQCLVLDNYFRDRDKIPVIKKDHLSWVIGDSLVYDDSSFVHQPLALPSVASIPMLEGIEDSSEPSDVHLTEAVPF
jgi:hypothetical protein